MVSKDIMAEHYSTRVDSNRNNTGFDLTTTLDRKRKVAQYVRISVSVLSAILITLRDASGLYYLLTIEDKAVSVSRWFSVAILALNIVIICFFGDAIRRIHLSQKSISQMKADAPFFLAHFVLIIVLLFTDLFYLIWLADPSFDFKQENRVEFS